MIPKRILLLGLCLFVCVASAYRHKLDIKNDKRQTFFIENFGFKKGGVMTLRVSNWQMDGKDGPWEDANVGFEIRHVEQDTGALASNNNEYLDPEGCNSLPVISYEGPNTARVFKVGDENMSKEGFYDLHFINCKQMSATFTLELEEYNVNKDGTKDFLPAGLSPLPTIYGVFALSYVVMLIVWIFAGLRGQNKKVNRIHHLMTLLIVLKALSLLFEAVEQHYLKVKGEPNGWDIAYYIFAALRTFFFFVILALIGSGWAFIKPFLSEKDKKILCVVIPLQVVDNIAMIIVGETQQGSHNWETWRDVFKLIDFICCGAVLIPIIWSIKHLREASQIDGKAARNLQKLKLFRQFYLYVVVYIYFTRIIIYLLDAILPFHLVWLGEMFTEMAALIFFTLIGIKFSPRLDNPYFKLDDEESADKIREMEIQNPSVGED